MRTIRETTANKLLNATLMAIVFGCMVVVGVVASDRETAADLEATTPERVREAYRAYWAAHDEMLRAEAIVNEVSDDARTDGWIVGNDEFNPDCNPNDWSNFDETWLGNPEVEGCLRIEREGEWKP